MFITAAILALTVPSIFASGFNYDDMDKWGHDFPYCAASYTHQSPININTHSLHSCPSNKKLSFSLNRDINKFTVSNTGHNIKISPIYSNVHQVDQYDFGLLENNFYTHSNEHVLYCLDSVHFHWGLTDSHGSEHKINGFQKQLEMHFVHYSCDYKNLAEAVAAKPYDPYTLAVVGVLFKVGQKNEFLEKIADNVLHLRDAHNYVEIDGMDIASLVPHYNSNDHEFYHYKGSLTTPPCSPIVSWHVLKDEMTVSEEQLHKFRSILNEENHITAPNYRQIQTNTHPVFDCGNNSGNDNDDDSD